MGVYEVYSVLDNVNSKDATYVLYYVIKILNKGKNGPSTIIDIDNIETDLNYKQQKIADQLLDEVHYKTLNNNVTIDKIIADLYEVLKTKKNMERSIDINRGKELLEKIKNDEDI
jgi:hypothetical protein